MSKKGKASEIIPVSFSLCVCMSLYSMYIYYMYIHIVFFCECEYAHVCAGVDSIPERSEEDGQGMA